MDKNSIAASKIKNIRLQKNILQKSIASDLGISENAYSRIENGYTQLTINSLYSICKSLSCKIEDVLDISNQIITNNNSNIVLSQFNDGSFNVTLSSQDLNEFKRLLQTKINQE